MNWSQEIPFFNHIADDFTHGHYKMVNTKVRLIAFFVCEDGEVVYNHQKQDLGLTVYQQNSGLN